MRTGAAGYVTGAVCVFAAWSRRPSIFFFLFPFAMQVLQVPKVLRARGPQWLQTGQMG